MNRLSEMRMNMTNFDYYAPTKVVLEKEQKIR